MSVNNRLPLANTELLESYAKLDPRIVPRRGGTERRNRGLLLVLSSSWKRVQARSIRTRGSAFGQAQDNSAYRSVEDIVGRFEEFRSNL